jgi:hypothetical protein
VNIATGSITEPPSAEALVHDHIVILFFIVVVFAVDRQRFLLVDIPVYLCAAPSEFLVFPYNLLLQLK